MNTRNKNKAFAALPRNARRRASDRRGILLLVVLSLLTLFLMIGTAFIVTANQYRQMNKARGKVAEQTSAPVRQV
ncbi:MAG: hypothetical protein KDA57_11515, partial [Planctomycetales bacterium]|nr:hypothetical protein [Planctomycetales bacterium]